MKVIAAEVAAHLGMLSRKAATEFSFFLSIPTLLGGARNMVASMLAYQVSLVSLNWPLGGALAVALLAATLALIWAGQRAALLLAAGRRGTP